MQLKELPTQGTFELKSKTMDVLATVRTTFSFVEHYRLSRFELNKKNLNISFLFFFSFSFFFFFFSSSSPFPIVDPWSTP